jgi:hypothetical protein
VFILWGQNVVDMGRFYFMGKNVVDMGRVYFMAKNVVIWDVFILWGRMWLI